MGAAMPKLKPEVQTARREHILDAAETCFARTGFHRTTMHDICKEAGVSPGALYVYFDSKEALIAGISERDRAEFAERLDRLAAAPDFMPALRELGEQYFLEDSAKDHRMCLEIGLESTRNPRIGEIHQRIDRYVLESFQALFQKMKTRAASRRARHPDRGEGVHGGGRRHVLAPRRRSRLRPQGGHAGRAGVNAHAPQSGAGPVLAPIPDNNNQPTH
jgi:AcrR family transcriptional regulator